MRIVSAKRNSISKYSERTQADNSNMTTLYTFPSRINDHIFFGPSNNFLAITQDKVVEIYQVSSNGTKKLIDTLSGHDETISAIDIASNGLIVSCSQDRNAIVWKQDPATGKYKKDLVLLRINRAATCVKWSPFGNKFAVGSGSKIVAICYYEPENDWWISKHLKKYFNSTVISLDWHPNNVLLSCGTTDFKCFVLSAYIKGVDEKPPPTLWGSKLPFNTLCGNFISSPGGWVHDVAFSPSGNLVSFSSNDGTLTFVYVLGENEFNVISLKTNYLPFKSLKFLSENQLVAAGHNCCPVIFEGSESGWKESRTIDNSKKPAVAAPVKSNDDDDDDDELKKTGTSALDMFRQLDLKGKVVAKNAYQLATTHQNTISKLRIFDSGHISTCGYDGKVVVFAV